MQSGRYRSASNEVSDMGRRKITDEAETEAAQDSDHTDESEDRKQLTQRMPLDLVEDVDAFAENHGMSRNAAINFLVRSGLPEA